MDNAMVGRTLQPLVVGALLVSYLLLIEGCAQLQPYLPGQADTAPTNMTPDEQRLAKQSQAFNETIWEGCLVGGVGGGALGCALGKCDVTNVLLGAAAGAIAGCTAGAYLANLQRSHSTREQQLNVVINDVRRDNKNLSDLIGTAKRVIAADKAKLAQIDKSLRAGRISREQASRELASVDANQRNLQQTLSNVKKRHAELKEVAQKVGSSDRRQVAAAEKEMKQMNTQIAVLESELDSLVQRRSMLRVG